MGTFLLFRVTKGLQSYPGACKHIFRINPKMGKIVETNPTNCCRQPENRKIIGINLELIGRTHQYFTRRDNKKFNGLLLALYSKATFHQPTRGVLPNGLACSKFREHTTRYSWRTPSILAECKYIQYDPFT
jgi:hypothetical protein